MSQNFKFSKPLNIGILGRYDSARPPRASIQNALKHAAHSIGLTCATQWLDNSAVGQINLDIFDALFIAPGGPDEDMDQILSAIAYARDRGMPILGTCGGFQRMVMELLLSLEKCNTIKHQELDPSAEDAVFTGLTCQVVSGTSPVSIIGNTIARSCYQKNTVEEIFYCRFGLNPAFVPALTKHGLIISGTDTDGSSRIIELKNHLFFVGTLFVPQVQSTEQTPHPLLKGLLLAANTHLLDKIESYDRIAEVSYNGCQQ